LKIFFIKLCSTPFLVFAHLFVHCPGEARLFGTAHFVVTLFGIAHFVASPLWSRPFRQKFTKIILLFSISIFLIYKKKIFSVFSVFCLFLINFFPLHIKNKSSNTPLLFFYSIIPVTDKINLLIFHEIIFIVKIFV